MQLGREYNLKWHSWVSMSETEDTFARMDECMEKLAEIIEDLKKAVKSRGG